MLFDISSNINRINDYVIIRREKCCFLRKKSWKFDQTETTNIMSPIDVRKKTCYFFCWELYVIKLKLQLFTETG